MNITEVKEIFGECPAVLPTTPPKSTKSLLLPILIIIGIIGAGVYLHNKIQGPKVEEK